MEIFEDNRGKIIDLGNGYQIIESVAGSVRARHYHKKSGHYCILTRGALEYYEKDVGSNQRPSKQVIRAPAVFSTTNKVMHEMVFIEPSEFVCIRTGGSFTPEEYEQDLVRFPYSLKDEHEKQDRQTKPVPPTVWPEQA